MFEQAGKQNHCFAAFRSWGALAVQQMGLWVEAHELCLGLEVQRAWADDHTFALKQRSPMALQMHP